MLADFSDSLKIIPMKISNSQIFADKSNCPCRLKFTGYVLQVYKIHFDAVCISFLPSFFGKAVASFIGH